MVTTADAESVYGLDGSSGQLRWQKAWTNNTAGLGPAAAGGEAITLDTMQTLHAYEIKTGTELWTKNADISVFEHPEALAASSKAVLVLTDQNLSAYGLKSGSLLWKVALPTDGEVGTPPEIGGILGDHVIIDSGTTIEAVSIDDGHRLWRASGPGSTPMWPLVSASAVITHACDGEEMALDPATGKTLWDTAGPTCSGTSAPTEWLGPSLLIRWPADESGGNQIALVDPRSGTTVGARSFKGITPEFVLADKLRLYVLDQDSSALGALR